MIGGAPMNHNFSVIDVRDDESKESENKNERYQFQWQDTGILKDQPSRNISLSHSTFHFAVKLDQHVSQFCIY